MRFPGVRQALHWLFLAVGIFSVMAMAVSVGTYLDYAEGGYGLGASVSEAWLSGDGRLYLRLSVENPGGLDIQMGMGPNDGNMTLGNVYPIHLDDALIKAGNGTAVILSSAFVLSAEDLEAIRSSGIADIALNVRLYVPERDMATYLRLEALGTEVRT